MDCPTGQLLLTLPCKLVTQFKPLRSQYLLDQTSLDMTSLSAAKRLKTNVPRPSCNEAVDVPTLIGVATLLLGGVAVGAVHVPADMKL